MGKTEDLVIVLLIVLVLFGAKRIPDLARSIGQAAREVRKGFSGEESVKSQVSTAEDKES